MAVVEVQDLRRSYGKFEALKGVSFTIEGGEIVGLLGPNGAGKSTTMKILTGYLAPTGGEARIEGHDVLTEPLAVRRRLGYLPESAPVYTDMTVGAYLAFIGRARGLGAAERSRAIEKTAAECGITERLSQRIGTLSRGFKQRVGLAQALLHAPPLLILDEPTSGLDPNQIVEIRRLIRHVGQTRTVVLSTHILSEVQVTCDRVMIIHNGELVADGPTEQITAETGGHELTVGIGTSKVDATEAELRDQLSAIDGVRRVVPATPLDEAHRFTLEADTDVRREIFEWAVTRGHTLLELSGRRSSLEDVFRRLTGDA